MGDSEGNEGKAASSAPRDERWLSVDEVSGFWLANIEKEHAGKGFHTFRV
ncbi:MAG: hypothetical protein ACJAWY_000777 [Sphingomonas echinoides]